MAKLTSEQVNAADALDVIELFFRNNWTDGLPVVPPTPEKVGQMIDYTGRDPKEELGEVPPKMGVATIEKLAINSVMGGCLPEHFPVVVAAVEAVLDPEHGLAGTQMTTHMNEPLIIINGPIRKELKINSKDGVFGRGFRSNGVIGRALRLILWNLGGNYPGDFDKSCFSHPGSWSFCIAEDEEACNWEPLSVERGISRGTSAVTVFSCESPHSIAVQGSVEEQLTAMVNALTSKVDNNFYFMGQTLLVFNPYNAKQLADAGYSKKDVKNYLWEKSKLPVGLRKQGKFFFSLTETHLSEWASKPDDFLMPMVEKPENIHIITAGGNYFNAVCPGWGCVGGFAVTREIKKPINQGL